MEGRAGETAYYINGKLPRIALIAKGVRFPKGQWVRLTGDQVSVSWSVPEDGKLMEITMKGKLSGDTITGTAKIGDVGEGPLTARRTADN